MVALLLLLAGVASGLTVDWSWKPPPLEEALGMSLGESLSWDRDYVLGATDEVVLTLGHVHLRAHSAKTGEVVWQKTLGQYTPFPSKDKPAFIVPQFYGPQDWQGRFSGQEGPYLAVATQVQKDSTVLFEVWDARDGTAVRSFTVGPVMPPWEHLTSRLAVAMGEQGTTVGWVSPDGRIVVEHRRLDRDGTEWRAELAIPSLAGWDVPGATERATVLLCPLEDSVLVVAMWPTRSESELHLLDGKTGTELKSVRLPFWVLEATYVPEKKLVLLAASDAWSYYRWGTEGDVLAALRTDDLSVLWHRSAAGVLSLGKPAVAGGYAYLLVIPEDVSGNLYPSGQKAFCARIEKLEVSSGDDAWEVKCSFQQGLFPSKNELLAVQRRAFANPVLVGNRLVVVLPGFGYEEKKKERYQVLLMSCEEGRELARVTVESPPEWPWSPSRTNLNGPVGLHQVGERIYLDTFGGGLFGLSLR